MKKFKISGIYTEYIYAEDRDEALEKFDEEMEGITIVPFDEVMCEELPLSAEN